MSDTERHPIKIPAGELLKKPGRPRQLLYAIVTRAISDYAVMQRYRPAHLEYLHQLDVSGCLLGAGPTLNGQASYYEGDGLIIVTVESIESARNIAEADPFHRNKVREYEIKPWLLSEGAVMSLL